MLQNRPTTFVTLLIAASAAMTLVACNRAEDRTIAANQGSSPTSEANKPTQEGRVEGVTPATPSATGNAGTSSDANVTLAVNAALSNDPQLRALAVGVDTVNGVVQLSGFATSANEKSMAESLARGTSGVTSVRNDIVIRN